MRIHPSAIVDPAALIAPDVEIGPFCLVGAGIEIGHGTIVQSHVVLEGAVRIGAKNLIGHGSIIGAPPQDLGFKAETSSSVVIGESNIIREHCTIHRGNTQGSSTSLGNGNFLMAAVHVGHNSRIGNGVVIANNSLLAGHVEIGDHAFIGGGTGLHQYTKVGRLVMTQGNSSFSKDIPPFVIGAGLNMVRGLNVVGMRRAGFSVAERDEIKRAFKLLYKSGLNMRQALEQAAATDFGPLAREFFAFVANTSKRGIASSSQAKQEHDV